MKTKHLIQLIAFVVAILFFVPTFCVSCDGAKINISGGKILTGVQYGGESITEPAPAVLLCLAVPVVIICIWLIKNEAKEKLLALATAILAVAEIIIWMVVKYRVSMMAEDNYCDFKTLAAFKFILILNGALVVVAVLVLMGLSANRMLLDCISGLGAFAQEHASGRMDTPVQGNVSGRMDTPVQGNMSGRTNPPAQGNNPGSAAVRFCPQCGAKLPEGARFCGKCGSNIL